jgi:hypothetical protein
MTPGNETSRLGARWRPAPNPRRLHAHARREHAVRPQLCRGSFGSKNLKYAADWLADDFVEHQVFPGTTPDKKGAIDSYRIFFAASPDMTAEIHDMVAAGDKVAIRATYRGTDEGGFIPNMPATGNPSKWRPSTSSGSTTRDKSSTPSEQWDSWACFRTQNEWPLPR